MEKEIELLTRVAANYLFLGQFEALRASLLSLRKRRPAVALAFLRRIVFDGGRIDGVLWSPTCPSPSHLAWLSALELLEFDPASSIWSFDPDSLRLKVEFLLLVQLITSKTPAADADADEKAEPLRVLNRLSDLGLQRLRNDVADVVEVREKFHSITDDELKCLWGAVLHHPDIFNALCGNIQRQLRLSEPEVPELAIILPSELTEGIGVEEKEALVWVQRSVQMAHLDALRERLRDGDVDGAVHHLPFLQHDHGVDASEYRVTLQDLIKFSWSPTSSYGETWQNSRSKMTLMYLSALSSSSVQLVQTIQAIQDEVLSDEVEKHTVSDANSIPLPLHKYLETLTLKDTDKLHAEVSQWMAVRSCIRDLYHYARISGIHILECVVETALSAVRMEQLHVASDVLSLFPLLQPLVAVLGWDLLSGKTAVRRTLMQVLWTSKSQVLRLEEYPLYGKQSDEVSCVEYLCDLLCFHLDVAYFVSCVNSGHPWSSKDSSLFSRKEVADEKDTWISDPFVENLVLERLAIESPMRVLFDVVPGIKFQDAIELMSLQPIASTSAAWKRMQDIELMHMRYALESAVLAFGAMDQCLGDESETQFRMAIWHLKNLQNHIDAVTDVPRKIFLVSIVTSLLHMDDMAVDSTQSASSHSYPVYGDHPDLTSESGNRMVISFTGLLLDILHHNLPATGPELGQNLKSGLATAVRQALDWRIFYSKSFIEDWEWRLSILQRLEPLSERTWSWKEALVILRAAPSKLLNL